MEYGLQIWNLEPARLRAVAQAAEGLGFDLLLFPDHLVAEGPERQLDPQHLSYDSIMMAATVADATKRIRIGHLVLCNLFRHPAITAQSLMTLDHFSSGRLVAGLGSGWTETEFRMTGIPFPPIAARLRMLDEALTCVRSLWTKEQTTFSGEFYQLRDAILWPKPLQKPHPPILVGGGGKGLLRIAAKHADCVNIILDAGATGYVAMDKMKRLTDDAFREKVQFLREEAKRNGRDVGSIRISITMFTVMITDSRDATRKAAEMMGQAFGMSPEMLLRSPMGLIGTPEECIVELKRRAKDWGVGQFIFSGGIGSDEKQMRRLKEEIVAHL